MRLLAQKRRRIALIFSAFLWGFGFSLPAEAKRIALVIGINSYENLPSHQQLSKALNDSRVVAQALKDIGFQVIQAQDTRRNDFLRAWQRFLDQVQPGDTAALYYAGHGVELNGANYLLTLDVPAADDGEDVLKSSGLRVGALMERLKEQQPAVTLFIIDACRNSPYASAGIKRSIGSTRGLKREEPPAGVMVMMSAGTGQEALDSLSPQDPHPNSVYTRTLVPLMKEPGLEITELAKRVRAEVSTLAATIRHEQRPAFYHELSGNFYLVPPAAAPVATTVQPAIGEVAQVWSATKDSTSVAVLEAFSRQFPNTVYADLARARIDELKRGQVAATGVSVAAPILQPDPVIARPRSDPLPPSRAKPSAFEAAQAWSSVRESTNPAALEKFVLDFADSIYVTDAKARLDELKKRSQVASAPAPQAPPAAAPNFGLPSNAKPLSSYDAAQAWVKIRAGTNVADIEAFLREYGDSIYADMARQRLSELKKLALLAPAQQSQRAPSSVTPVVGIFSPSRSIAPLTASEAAGIQPMDTFRECQSCPEMIVIPAGQFMIGSPQNEPDRNANEGPQRPVNFTKKFAVGKFAITFEEWDACVAGGGCEGYRPADEGLRGRFPVINVSWSDAQTYVAWLTKTTGKSYRLLSEAEREYVTRAGTSTIFWFGNTISSAQANYDGRTAYNGGSSGEYRQRRLAVDALAPNPFGLYHVHGNVEEWVEDCWLGDHSQAPADGAARVGECGRRVLRGGSWYEAANMLRSASRTGFYPGFRSNKIGFRVARSL